MKFELYMLGIFGEVRRLPAILTAALLEAETLCKMNGTW